jgi:ribosomal protein S18 acetylase RimI-like enzyme
MDFEFKVKKLLINEDIKKISFIHFHNINGKIHELGISFIRLLYDFFNEDHDIFFSICKKNDQLIGFAAFTLNNKLIYKKFFFKNFFKILIFILKNIYNFKLIKNFFLLILSSFKSSNLTIPCELLSISVSNNFRRKGIASKLVYHSEKYLDKIKVNQYIVRTEENNLDNNLFYMNNNFIKIKTLKYFAFNMNLYLKNLNE